MGTRPAPTRQRNSSQLDQQPPTHRTPRRPCAATSTQTSKKRGPQASERLESFNTLFATCTHAQDQPH
eukprot:11659951-Prorocentrum_lima.AAC.1